LHLNAILFGSFLGVCSPISTRSWKYFLKWYHFVEVQNLLTRHWLIGVGKPMKRTFAIFYHHHSFIQLQPRRRNGPSDLYYKSHTSEDTFWFQRDIISGAINKSNYNVGFIPWEKKVYPLAILLFEISNFKTKPEINGFCLEVRLCLNQYRC